MKKNKLAISGIIIQGIALVFMFYGLMNNITILWIALPFVFIGLAMAIGGAIKNSKTE